MFCFAFFLLVLFGGGPLQDTPDIDRSRITIIDTGKPVTFEWTNINAGPAVGNMLNVHFYPGMNYYNAARYVPAEGEFTYVVSNSWALDANPRRAEYLSTAHYLRGMIYFYHAIGPGRYSLARADFQASIKWNPNNHMSYIELSRVYSSLGFRDQAISILQNLLALGPDEKITTEVENELKMLKSQSAKTAPSSKTPESFDPRE